MRRLRVLEGERERGEERHREREREREKGLVGTEEGGGPKEANESIGNSILRK